MGVEIYDENRIRIGAYDKEVDEAWHIFMIRFKPNKKHFAKVFSSEILYSVEYYIDTLQHTLSPAKSVQSFRKSHEFIFSYGSKVVEYRADTRQAKTVDTF